MAAGRPHVRHTSETSEFDKFTSAVPAIGAVRGELRHCGSRELMEVMSAAEEVLEDADTKSLDSGRGPKRRSPKFGLWGKSELFGIFFGTMLAIFFMSWNFAPESPKANTMLAVTSFVACFWVCEVLPLPVTSLLPMALIPLMGIQGAEEVAHAYWSWISMLFVGAFVVDAAIEHVELPTRVALLVLTKIGVARPWAVMASFLGLSYFLSMFCSNVATALMLVPFATALLDTAKAQAEAELANAEAEEETEKDNCAAVSVSLNVNDKDEVEDAPKNAAAKKQTDDKVEPEEAQGNAEKDDVSKLWEISKATRRKEKSQKSKDRERSMRDLQRFSNGVLLAIAYGASLGGVATLIGTPVNGVLAGQDIISRQINIATWFFYAFPVSLVALLLAFLILHLVHTRGVRVPLSIDELEKQKSSLEPFWESRDEQLVALVQIGQVVGWVLRPYCISPFLKDDKGEDLVNDAVVACLFAALLFVLPSKKHPGKPVMPWPVAEKKVPWGVLLLMGAGFALARGFEHSGLTQVLGTAVGKSVADLPPLILTFAVIVPITLITEVTSNTATANVMLPLLSSVALETLVNPALMLMPAALACSFAFLLPAATGPNSVIFATGRIGIQDFFKSGSLMTLIVPLVEVVVCYAMGVLIFKIDEPFPKDSCLQPGCTWVEVAGEVMGSTVQSQACRNLEAVKGLCKIWNGSTWNITSASFAV
eukprot:TRINITY_DN4706_c2_g2_i1.p1 TRINITY_DN4706_c2_g2~~TRINITY_DN4706_c2_g2_i1.p1  ORF type:complete len:708 (-),score=123.00 TRINITY_DN4706_c2_g2_i1:181-2304(-)